MCILAWNIEVLQKENMYVKDDISFMLYSDTPPKPQQGY